MGARPGQVDRLCVDPGPESSPVNGGGDTRTRPRVTNPVARPPRNEDR